MSLYNLPVMVNLFLPGFAVSVSVVKWSRSTKLTIIIFYFSFQNEQRT